MWPEANPDWMNDPRPAAASIEGELFPEAHARAVQAASPVDVGLAAIKAHDPNFELEQFTQQVQRVFFLVEEAWSERKAETTRRVMADALWQTNQVRIQGYADTHKRNLLDNLAVSNIWPVAAHSDDRFDTITVRIVAASADYDLDDNTGRVFARQQRGQTVGGRLDVPAFLNRADQDGGHHHRAKVPELRGAARRRPGGHVLLLQGLDHVGGL